MKSEVVARLRPGPLDIHAHIVPDRLLERFAAGARPGFGLEKRGGARHLVIAGETMRMAVMPAMHSLELRLQAMHQQGVAAQLVSPWIALANYRLAESDAIWFSEVINETIAEFARRMPDRFVGIGSVPLQAPERAAVMLGPLMRDLGLLGVEINTNAGPDKFLDDPSLEPFWAAAEELGAFVLIHPSLGGTGPDFARYYLNNLIHNPLETTVAAAHLIFGGVMERHPGLKICLVHGGGFLPYGLGRLRRGRQVRPETHAAMSGSVEDSFRRFYFDTVTHSAEALKFLVSLAGADHVLLGSDYPFDMADPEPVGTVQSARLGEASERLILRGAAQSVLRATLANENRRT
jgi:aminocarboxymuconate-semialdehyde decarboxylase